jgi:ABC-type oligopeptide transport system substrate-binding subunit/DNA-binding SARP family transcriptional activator
VITLRFRFLGPLDIHSGDRQLPKPATLKSQSLLAYLVLHRDQPQPRERLAGMLWGERSERRARGSLSTALWHIRRCLPQDDLILSDPHTVQFSPSADVWLDVEAFRGQASCEDVNSLQAAVALYRGPLLDGFYDDWIVNERYRLETLFADALVRLVMGHEEQENDEAALAAARRLLQHDPLREGAHRAAMRAYCRLGRRNAALEQYQRCREIVQEELGTEPMVETTELWQAILERRFEVGSARQGAPAELSAVEPSGPRARSPLDAVAASPFVGREEALGFLDERWREARAGDGGLALISGEAGVGKTRLVQAFADQLRWQGARILGGRCYEFTGNLPYQSVAEALGTIVEELTADRLAHFPAWTVQEVARLVPGLAERVASHPTDSSGDEGIGTSTVSPAAEGPVLSAASLTVEGEPGSAAWGLGREQARLFDGLARFLAELSSRQALLMVLEDLHWAGESTLELLHYLARHLAAHQVLMVGTFRPEAVGLRHPLVTLRRRLAREGLVKPLRLSRLSAGAVERMVVEMSGAGEAVAPLARRLYEETDGNPFFVLETVKALFQAGVLHLGQGVWTGDFAAVARGAFPLPSAVGEVIEARVQRLDEEAQEALRVAAVLGQAFDFDLLGAAWGRGSEATLEALDTLLRRRLIEEGVSDHDYAFSHNKIREAVYTGMGRRRRQRLHAQVGTAMERVYGAELDSWVGELAFHFRRARELDPSLTDKAVAYLLQAGDRARHAYAHREAIAYYEDALALLKEQGAYQRAARTLMKLGLTHHNGCAFGRARQAYEEGFALWRHGGRSGRTGPLPAAPHALRVFWLNLPTLDPTVSNHAGLMVTTSQLFRGLVDSGPEMEMVPDLARDWEISDGGRRYVFHLREDARWSDGTQVTAADFEYTWKRVLDPVTGSPCAGFLYDVAGAMAFHREEAGWEDVGVRVEDDATLVVELEGPRGYFLQLLGDYAGCALPRHAIEAHGESWTEVGNIVTSGPFRLVSWQPGESMVLVRNPAYRGRFTGNVERVELTLQRLKEWPDTVELYESDELDVLLRQWFIPPAERDRIRHRYAGEMISIPALHTGYVGFDVSRAPFDDGRVRQAFALAIDKEMLNEVVNRGYWSPATGGFLPPTMPGHSPGIGLSYNPERARQLLAEAGYPDGQGFPDVQAVTFHGIEATVEYLRAQWHDILGVEVPCQALQFEESEQALRGEIPTISISAWQASYPDPSDFMPPGMGSACSGWRCAAFDRLVNEARRTMDQGERMRLYRQADEILVEEVPVVPFCHLRWGLLVKPWVSRYPASPMRQWFWKDVVIEPH